MPYRLTADGAERRRLLHLIAGGAALLAGAARLGRARADGAADDQDPPRMKWRELMPQDWRPANYFAQVAALNGAADDTKNWSDDDPRARARLARIIKLGADAPPVRALHGRVVWLPGFVLPLEQRADAVPRFLLVPYQGACVHVPPPPANQAALVQANPPLPAARVPYPLWVKGRITLQAQRTPYMAVAYRIDATAFAPFDEVAERAFLPLYTLF